MKAYKIRDNETGNYFSENRTPSKEYATIWYTLESLFKFLKVREQNEAAHRSVYSGYGEKFSGSLLPKNWEIVKVLIVEEAAISLTSILKEAAEADYVSK